MLYLIGGSPRCGKTMLSKKMSKKLGVPYFSTDNARPFIWGLYKGKERSQRFPFDKMFSPKDIDGYFQKYSSREILQADLMEAKTMQLGIDAFIEYMLACKMDYILEGVHLLPKHMDKYKNRKDVRIVYLANLNEEKILKGILKNKDGGDWLLSNTKDERSIRAAARSVAEYGKYFSKETEKYGFKMIGTEDNFFKSLDLAAKYLTK